MKNNTINQSGRSMIEMLGVLAIVGVLSVGGIAGYSKAMQKYRTNKTIEQVIQIINGVRTLYSQQKNYYGIEVSALGIDNGSHFLRKAKILPESAWECAATEYCYPKNPFGGNYQLYPWGRKTPGDDKAVRLELRNIPDDACIELATQDWGASEGLYAVGINLSGTIEGCTGVSNEGIALGCAGASGSGSVPLPIPMDAAVSACASNNDNQLNFDFF